MQLQEYKEELDEKGYVIIEDILTAEELKTALEYFNDWIESNEQILRMHNKISPHGIFKHFQAGHQRHAWYLRTRPNVQKVFQYLWNTEDLVVSYDGCCLLDETVTKKDNIWTHTDQAPKKKGLYCYQGFVSLTDNTTRTLVVYEGSHKLHEKYFADRKISHNKDWHLIDHEYLESIKATKRVLAVKAGSLVIWDSRTFHQNQYGEIPEKRIVQYISYLPAAKRNDKMFEKRLQYFINNRTTSHWAYPVKVNGLQPQAYGDTSLKIDYTALKEPDLEDMFNDILKLI